MAAARRTALVGKNKAGRQFMSRRAGAATFICFILWQRLAQAQHPNFWCRAFRRAPDSL